MVYETVMNTGVVLGIISAIFSLVFLLLNTRIYILPLGRVLVFGSTVVMLIDNLKGTFIYNLPGLIMFLFVINLPSFVMIGWMHWAIREIERVVKKNGCTERCVEKD